MSLTIIFPILIGALLLRIFWLRLKASNARSQNFKQLPLKDQLAVLKECLLNSPSALNLANLQRFCSQNGLDLDAESYRIFIKKQQELRNRQNALEEDNQLFTQEAQWLDKIEPLEFSEARQAKSEGDRQKSTILTLEGIARLYSDEQILEHLENIETEYPKARALKQKYQSIVELRDTSAADNESLEKLRKIKNEWDSDLLNFEP